MCLGCWDADIREERIRKGEMCHLDDVLKMSLEELKTHVMEEWLVSKKTFFRVYKQAVPQMQDDRFLWETASPLNSSEKLQIKINFI